jgi:hypothetical protein
MADNVKITSIVGAELMGAVRAQYPGMASALLVRAGLWMLRGERLDDALALAAAGGLRGEGQAAAVLSRLRPPTGPLPFPEEGS